MVDQKIAEQASQAAAANIGELMTSIHTADGSEPTVYFEVFRNTLEACGITQEELEVRVRAYALKHSAGIENAVAGNLLKEAVNPNMGQKIFIRLIKALFPAA